ncbi:DUF5134 domain-containing protein [Mycobacterium sp. ACS4331]|uniref:DUF5134 domain-containing protein n=1 Tax=Mycobacterium sp. ACS4331 TaxID=1834121 RepID=UPI0007FD261E|nr:DUF5134 domain-containing protein [Mycobacterium sp. ACS4331]OBF28058.1 DUF5134 domain-containing protein [Mycobacterium sp. ACS4331]
MIADLWLRWVVTILFSLSALECGYAVAISRRRPGTATGHVLHLVMAVAMAVMAWPRGAELPTTGPMVFFTAAAAWFLAVMLRSGGSWARLVNAYHAVMMLAMAWMYAVMNGTVLPGQATGHGGHEHAHGYAAWIAAVNWFWTVGFAVAAVGWTHRYFAGRQRAGGRMSMAHFGTLCQAMIAAGMAIMFGVML